MNKNILYLLFISLSVVNVSCTSEDSSPKRAGKVITVALTPTMDCFPLYVAEKAGIAASCGYALDFQTHASRSDCDTALIYGSAIAIMTDSVRASSLSRRIKDVPDSIKCISADSLSYSYHNNIKYYFFTNHKSRIKKPSQLADRMIALDRNSGEAQMAQRLVDSLKISDKCFLVQMQNINTRVQMLTSNSMDAAVLPEPQATKMRTARHNMIYSVTADSRATSGCLVSVKNHADLKRIYNAAVDTINKYGIHRYDSVMVTCMHMLPEQAAKVPAQKFQKLR